MALVEVSFQGLGVYVNSAVSMDLLCCSDGR